MALYGSTNEARDINFYFHAPNQAQADARMVRWNRYHGFAPSFGWRTAIETTIEPDPEDIHDDYLK